MGFLLRAILIVAAVAVAVAADAQPKPGGGPRSPGGGLIVQFNADQIAQLFTEAGFQSTVVKGKDNPYVKTKFWDSDTPVGASPIYCDKKDNSICNGIQLVAIIRGAGVDQNWANAWNSRFFFVRAYLDSDGDLVFVWDALLQPGVSSDYVKRLAVVFKAQVDASTDFKP